MLLDGERVDHYEILEKLGEGGMGRVYKARDSRLDRLVAIKLLAVEKTGDKERILRFATEARAASRLNHPNIITIYDISFSSDCHYIVMEYVAGKPLEALISRKGIRLEAVLDIAIQIADAMTAASDSGIIHRDLKPSNIMVSDQGVVKVVDFGLAKLLTSVDQEETLTKYSDHSPNTQQGAVLGTVAYMSPEQAEARPLDRRSDIFSFGSVLYEMVTGHRAFRGQSQIATISSILRDDPAPISETSIMIPPDLEKIVLRCLRKDPDRRFQHFADLRVALLEVKEQFASSRITTTAATKRKIRSWKIISAALAAVLILGLIAFPWLRARQGTKEGYKISPFTSYPGFQGYPTFSPDGTQAAFIWNGGQGLATHVYVKMIGAETYLPLTNGPLPDINPSWAPNGKSIAFLRHLSATRTAVFTIDPLGGQERMVAEIIFEPYQALSWSHDSKWLVASAKQADGQAARIVAIAVDTGQMKWLSLGSNKDESYPAISMDGHSLAFMRMLAEANWAILTVPIDSNVNPTGPPRLLKTRFGLNRQPAWTVDGEDVLVSNGSTGNSRLWRISAKNSHPPEDLRILNEVAYQPAVSPVGERMLFARDFNNGNIWKVNITGEGKVGPATTIFDSPRSSWVRPFALSPDGHRVAFESARSGPYGVWVGTTDGTRASLIYARDPYSSGSPAWSPDGRFIAFDTRVDEVAAIYVVTAEGSGAHRLTSLKNPCIVPSWSHDGKWIYFNSNRTGRMEIFKIAPDGTKETQVTHNGGWASQESPDGKTLYFTKSRNASTPLLKMPVEGGPESVVLPSVHDRWWTVASDGIWFLQDDKPGIDAGFWLLEVAGSERGFLRFFSFAQNRMTTAALLPRPPAGGLAISADEKTLIFDQLDHRASEIDLVENFR
jgi:eukaryotic-like serine/threonine-protein kinase